MTRSGFDKEVLWPRRAVVAPTSPASSAQVVNLVVRSLGAANRLAYEPNQILVHRRSKAS
jgi:hypothetical protein